MAYQPVVHNVQGCRYTEFRGVGHPPLATTPSPSAGDIYLDIQIPRGVWVYSGTHWTPWPSMEQSRSVPHPNIPRILCPNAQQFAWVPESGFTGFKRQVDLLLDGQQDNAHIHVTNILNNEGTTTEETVDNTSSKTSSDSGSSDDNSGKQELSNAACLLSKPGEVAESSVDDPQDLQDVDAMMVDIEENESEEDNTAERFKDACFKMRRTNHTIALEAERPGMSHINIQIDICFTNQGVTVGEDNTREHLVSLCEGLEFPTGTRTVEWPAHNVDTFMPFTGVPGSRDRASRPDHLSSRKDVI